MSKKNRNRLYGDWLNPGAYLVDFLMEEDPNWMHPGRERSYEGWSVSLAATTRF